MPDFKPIETEYKGYRFRSRLEARWAVFFDACGVKWDYEVEGFDLGDGIKYLPDFVLYDVHGLRDDGVNNDLYVEVKGRMTKADAEKIRRFHKEGARVLVVGCIPDGTDAHDIYENVFQECYNDNNGVSYYNFETIDDDFFGAFPGVDKEGHFTLFGDDLNYLRDLDYEATEKAYRAARQARFEFGEKGGL